MNTSRLLLLIVFLSAISTYSSPGQTDPGEHRAVIPPYPRLLPLQLTAPVSAQVDSPVDTIRIHLKNSGAEAPNARLRIIIHPQQYQHAAGHFDLTADNVSVEVLEEGSWIPVELGMAEAGVLGAIGPEGATTHRERHHRGGFAIPAGMNKTWQLRVTFKLPGTYSLIAAVSPDNGSRHLAQPAHAVIEVK